MRNQSDMEFSYNVVRDTETGQLRVEIYSLEPTIILNRESVESAIATVKAQRDLYSTEVDFSRMLAYYQGALRALDAEIHAAHTVGVGEL